MDNMNVFYDDPIDSEKLRALQMLLNSVDNDTSPIGVNVISGMSGGRDSIYQAYLLSQVLSQNVLCMSWVNDFMTKDAHEAIFNSAKHFRSIQYMTFSFAQDVYCTFFGAMHQVFKRFCFCATTMLLKAIPLAIDNKIPFICVGFSPDQLNEKGTYSFGDRAERIKRIQEYIVAFRAMVLHAVNESSPSMVNQIDAQMFGQAMQSLEKLETCEVVPGMLMLAEFLPWKYSTVQRIVYDVFGIKNEGRNSLHSNCIYEPLRGYVEYLLKRPFLQKEASYIVKQGSLTDAEAEEALRSIHVQGGEPAALNTFLRMASMEKDAFYRALNERMTEKSLSLLTHFVYALNRFQGYRGDKPIRIIE